MAAAPTRAIIPMELGAVRPAGGYSFDELYRFAQMCHTSGMFADVTDAAQAMIKIVKGQELGLPPTTAMTAFDIIQKRLFIKPWAIAALINACGYGSYRVREQSTEQCTILFTRKYAGRGWVECPLVSYTIAEAQAHGLVQRSPHWKASPAHMLYQRAMGRGGAMYFPELLAGLQAPPEALPQTEEQQQENIIALFGEQMDPTAYTLATGQPLAAPEDSSDDGRSEAWRTALHKKAYEMLNATQGLKENAMTDKMRNKAQEGFDLAEDPDATQVQGEAVLEALRTLRDELAGQVKNPPAERFEDFGGRC